MNDIQRLIADSATPPPPQELEVRVLAAVRQASFESTPEAWWWRPPVRWAWAGITATLLAANLLVGAGPAPAPSGPPKDPFSEAARRLAVEDPLLADGLVISAISRPAHLAPARDRLDPQSLVGGLNS